MRKLEILSVLLLIFVSQTAHAKAPNKTLNALWNLQEMAECRLGYTALAYNDYGCWCGVGGSGDPIDDIDRCCMNHDRCYDYAVDNKICVDVPFEYVEDYTWTCTKNNQSLRPEPVCEEGQNKCKQYLCWCDRQVVDCWSEYARPLIRKSCTRDSSGKSVFKKVLNAITDFFGVVVNGFAKLFSR